jgi:tetratricopeptide (TPR) repeat protein
MPELSDGYRALRARASFLAENYRDAAAAYEDLLQRTPKDSPERLRIYNSIELCYEMADDTDRLKDWLYKELEEFPNEAGLHNRLAELEARECDYRAALRHLREEVDEHPTEDVDWKISVILATSESSEDWDEVKATLKQVSPAWDSIQDLLKTHWPPFSHMCPAAQEEWVTGCWMRNFAPAGDRQRPGIRRKAALSCATAVEHEVRNRVFIPFQKHVASRPQLQRSAGDVRDNVFREFLLNGRSLGLGEMVAILARHVNATDQIGRAFQAFVAQYAPRLRDRQHQMAKIVAFRNPATHLSTVIADPDLVMSLCLNVIENLLR